MANELVGSAFTDGMIAGLRRELAQTRETAATCMRVAGSKQQQLDDLNGVLARYSQTIDVQRELIADLERDRDAWRDKAHGQSNAVPRERPTIAELEALLNSEDDRPVRIMPDGSIWVYPTPGGQASTVVHEAKWPVFPSNAQLCGDGIPR
jgi:hypothetical protein